MDSKTYATQESLIEKLNLVTVVVKNQEAALDFFTKTLGLEKRADASPPGAPRWVTVAPKGQDIEISLWEAGSRTEGVPPSHQRAGNGTSWNFQVKDCRKAYAELKARGVKFRSEPVEYPWAIAAAFTDPDGNPFGIIQPKATSPSAWK